MYVIFSGYGLTEMKAKTGLGAASWGRPWSEVFFYIAFLRFVLVTLAEVKLVVVAYEFDGCSDIVLRSFLRNSLTCSFFLVGDMLWPWSRG